MVAFTAFVDESGCDGFAFDRGSSEFLVIAAIICRTEQLGQYEDCVAAARRACRKEPDWRFKSFKDLGSVPQRWALTERLAASKCCAVAVAIHKPSLVQVGWAENPGDMYFHGSKYLVERISWACRDVHKARSIEDPRVRIVFSEKKALRYDKFQTYLQRLREDPGQYRTNAEWDYLDPALIEPLPHDDLDARLLAADYLAASLGLAFERKDQRVFDDRFARLWAPRIYRYNKRAVGNGLKIWPDEGLQFLREEARGDWMKMTLGW